MYAANACHVRNIRRRNLIGFAIAIIVLAVTPFFALTIPVVHAPTGEVYKLTTSAARVQEYNIPGVTLYINVSNAVIGTKYQLTFSVTAPTGTSHNSLNSTTATSASFILSVVYPRDFGAGVSLQYVGNYTINVSQNQPSNKPSVQTGQFQVGLTDSTTYQRTYSMSIEATGYSSNANITTSLVQGGNPAPGFPRWLIADTGGSLSVSWNIPPSDPIGAYTLTLSGTTGKTVPDTQTLTINPTTVSIAGLSVNSPTISRSLTQQLLFAAKYPRGQLVQTGQANIRIEESDGVTNTNVTGVYDSLTGNFHATYIIPRAAILGIWVATIDSGRFDDGYGNLGPMLAVSAGFYVQAATLNVTVLAIGPTGSTYSQGNVLPIYVSVSYPDATVLSSGTVTAKFSHAGLLVGSPVTLSYVPGQKLWAGTYQIASNDPSGIWLVTVDASDQATDTGEGTSSVAVNTLPGNSQSTGLGTSFFLFVAAIVASVALAVLLWAVLAARRKVSRSEVKLDLRLVDKEVDKIQGTEFFQRVKKQVEEAKPSEDQASSKTANDNDKRPS